MVRTHNLGFPRIGNKRELKFALESYWQGKTPLKILEKTGCILRKQHWKRQQTLDFTPVGDFSFYDHVLDMSFLLGNIPSRAQNANTPLDSYFQVARGRSAKHASSSLNRCDAGVRAGEMTKWFDTNYHYIVPEFEETTTFKLQPERLIDYIKEAKKTTANPKPVIIGPVTYLWLGKSTDHSDKLALLNQLIPVYKTLLSTLAKHGIHWVQIDEPILVTELSQEWVRALDIAYHSLKNTPVKTLLTTYFGAIKENLQVLCQLPVDGIHVDAIQNRQEIHTIIDWLPRHKILSLGVIDGRNIWKNDLNETLDWLEPIAQTLKARLWIAPSCSLIHVPLDLTNETLIDPEIRSWLAFAVQKIQEINILKNALNHGRDCVKRQLEENQLALQNRRESPRVHNDNIKFAVDNLSKISSQRTSHYNLRANQQQQSLNLPLFPTTTIGSFPQTQEIRQLRANLKKNLITKDAYQEKIQQEIAQCVQQQETLGLDVLVHGEAERNDMVEYFGEQLSGFVISQQGWVQSYGSRCVKPPILFGDISRPHAMTVHWTSYAQSLTDRPLKGMLTGPVTLLNWSFVRDDQPLKVSCQQLALAIRQEVLDLEKANINIIQIDEAALREGLPLRKSEWHHYLDWAVEAFHITANGVKDSTQIHTHMCYSEFNDIIENIIAMDADVITIETSRSNMDLLDAFDHHEYPNDIGPGIYDIHSPNTPEIEQITQSVQKAAEKIPTERLWINPDCGLKTRRWEEVIPALKNMVASAHQLRHQFEKITG